MPSQISKMKFDQVGVDGIKVYLSDFGYMESYRQDDLVKRFQSVLQKFGVAANAYVNDIMLPSSGGTDNTVYISPGTAITPNGGHISLVSTHSFAITGGDVGKWVVAEYTTMNIDARVHRETGVSYYMREVPTTGLASVFYTTASAPATTGDIVWLGKITAISGNKPVIDTSSTNRQLLSVHNDAFHDFLIWMQGLLDSARSNFEDLVTTRYVEIVNLLDNKIMPDGTNVQTTSETPPAPRNFRIQSITPVKNYYVTDSQVVGANIKLASRINNIGYKYGVSNVRFSWNWSDVEGTGSSSTFTITYTANSINSNYIFTADELVDFWLYIQNNGNYQIIGNNATSGGSTLLQVRDENGNSVNLTGIVTDTAAPAIIHSNATEYRGTITPILNSAISITSRYYISEKAAANALPAQIAEIELPIKARFHSVILADKVNASSTTELSSGSFNAYGAPVAYSYRFINKLPNIPTNSASVGVVATNVGFVITIVGFTDADSFEICWTTDNAGADFDNSAHERTIVTNRQYSVVTTASREYNIAVRPLQAGQVVADSSDWLTGTVVSGAGGRAPNEKLLPFIAINQEADYIASGVTIYTGSGDTTITVSPDPAWETNQWRMKRVTDSLGQQWYIRGNTSDTLHVGSFYGVVLSALIAPIYVGDSGPVLNPGSGSFTPVVQAPRRVYTYSFVNDVLITKIEFDCRETDGTPSVPAIIRVWQDGRESNAKMMEVNAVDSIFSQTIDLSIVVKNGNRTVHVDTWDPDNIGNLKSISGILTIFYRDFIYVEERELTIIQL